MCVCVNECVCVCVCVNECVSVCMCVFGMCLIKYISTSTGILVHTVVY